MVDGRIDKWTRWITGPIYRDITTLHGNRATWRLTNDVVRRNGRNIPPSHLIDLLAESYAHSQSVGVRRQVDRDPQVVSLGRLLTEMSQWGEVLTVSWYRSLFQVEMQDYATELFRDRFGRDGSDAIDVRRIRRNLADLERTSAQVRRYVDKHVAHYDRKPIPAQDLPTFNDLDRSVTYLGTLLKRYTLLLTAASISRVTPTPQYDVLAIFRQPWLPEPLKVRRRKEP